MTRISDSFLENNLRMVQKQLLHGSETTYAWPANKWAVYKQPISRLQAAYWLSIASRWVVYRKPTYLQGV